MPCLINSVIKGSHKISTKTFLSNYTLDKTVFRSKREENNIYSPWAWHRAKCLYDLDFTTIYQSGFYDIMQMKSNKKWYAWAYTEHWLQTHVIFTESRIFETQFFSKSLWRKGF